MTAAMTKTQTLQSKQINNTFRWIQQLFNGAFERARRETHQIDQFSWLHSLRSYYLTQSIFFHCFFFFFR